jgi:hypothetical protein
MSDENIIELNQEKEIIQVNEEKVEKEDKEEKDDKESSQEDQDNQKEQIKEEKIEEADLENQEPQENNEPEPETIIFSNLSKEEKIKYFNYFIANDTKFNREEEGTWIAEIEILEEEKPEIKSNDNLILSSANSNDLKTLRQSKFRSTKKDYDTIYSKLISVVNPPPGVKGAKMDINAIKYMIQEIYSLKFLKDTQALLGKEEEEPEAFPTFVGNFLVNKFPKKDMLYKKSIDFMLSLDFYGMKHKDIRVFQQFVTEEYDSDDLIFYLFVRSCIEKEQKQFFLEKAKENLGQGLLYGQEDDDILVPVKKCKKLAKAIFGGDEEELMNNFLESIKTLAITEPADEQRKFLKANSILNMALENYHDSRDEMDEANDDKQKDEEEVKPKVEEPQEKEEKEKVKEIQLKDKPKTILKKKKAQEEEIKIEFEDDEEDEKPKITSKATKPKSKSKKVEDNLVESQKDEDKIEPNEMNEDEAQTKLRSNKKSNKKPITATSNTKPKANITTKPKNPSVKQPKNTTTKPTNTIKVSKGVKTGPKTTVSKTGANRPVQTAQSKPNRTNIFTNPKLNSSTTVKSARKTSAEKKSNQTKSGNRTTVTSSVGKRPVKKNIHNFSLEEDKVEQTQDFKKILNKNRIEKVKTDTDKSACLVYIINDYFKLKEIDAYFKNIIEQNPIFQPLSAKIYANLKNPKEFLLKKLNGACKYISIGDKNGFYNFMKVKDKNGKSNFEGFKSNFNSLLKSGPLKDLNENDIGNFCRSLLEMPEISFQTSKSLLKLCE